MGKGSNRWGESGNVFFTLFGAVAMVGVVGVATSTLMRGPVGTVVSLNQQAKADSQLQIARKLSGLAAVDNDCDDDGYNEPLEPYTGPGCDVSPTGGGCLPQDVGASRTDPWGTDVGYCAWNHGPSTSGNGCPAGLLAGDNGTSNTVLALISAGPDRQFQTSCEDHAGGYVNRVAGSDDIIWEWTYDETADGIGGGLWSVKSPGTITPRDDVTSLDIGIKTAFSGGMTAGFRDSSRLEFDQGTRLDLSDGGMFNLPTWDGLLGLNECNGPDAGILRINTQSGMVLQICDPDGVGDWVDVGGSGAASAVAGSLGQIQFNAGDKLGAHSGLTYSSTTETLTVGSGGLSTSGPVAGGSLVISGTSNLQGNISNSTGNVTIVDTLDLDGDLDITGNIFNTGGTVRVTDDLDVTGALTVDGITHAKDELRVEGDISNPVGLSVRVNDALVVTGQATLEDGLAVTGGNANITNNLDVAGDTTLDRVRATSYEFGSIGSGRGVFSGGSDVQLRTGGANRLVADALGVEVTGRLSATSYYLGYTGAATNDYGFYQDGAGVTNYFGGSLGIGTDEPDAELHVVGDIVYTGTLTDISDMRLKTDIERLGARGSMLERIGQVDTYSFRMKDNDEGSTEFGVMAQELQEIFPELVRVSGDEMGTLSVNYTGLIAPMIEASKELKAENDALRAELAELRAQQDDILRTVSGLKAHTGYGIGKAQAGVAMLAAMGGVIFGLLIFGGALRIRRQHAE